MAYSTQRATSDGTLSYIDLSIDYIKRADISVFYDGLPADPETWAWVGVTDKRIEFTPNVPDGVEVLLARSTQINTIIHRFSSGAKFNNSTMDEDFKQLLYLNQEAVEGAALTDIFNDVDFHGYTIKNVGPAVEDGDALSLGQARADATTATGAALVATSQAAVATTKAGEAVAAAAAASSSSSTATTKADEAAASATAAAASAATADTKAGEAVASASTATGAASTATSKALEASDYAEDAAASAASVDPDNLVHRSGAENVGGVKTYTDSPLVPNVTLASNDGRAVNSKYVKDTVDPVVSSLTTVSNRTLKVSELKTLPTTVVFNAIPSWVNRMYLTFDAVQDSSGSGVLVQFAPVSGGFQNTGYISYSTRATGTNTVATTGVTDAFYIINVAGDLTGGLMFQRVSGNIWVAHGTFQRGGWQVMTAGRVALTGVLDRLLVSGLSSLLTGSVRLDYEA